MIDTLEKLGAYNVWANTKLLAHFDGIAAAGQQLPERTLRLFSHVLNAQAIWLARLTSTESPVKVWQEHDLAGLHKLHHQTSPSLHQYVQQADDQELHRVISYTNSLGDSYESQVSDILTHASVHANYHRAQVAADLRQNGLEPINTDFITYCRELSVQAKKAVPSL
ncbi:DinB family protein [Hymenobacter koreensis]|uniref:Damage-inducible protein DinB n=1 Tax=Hymenobacter koreensis TaxID=1084523 RepID=A0ABP8JGM9_9BACT